MVRSADGVRRNFQNVFAKLIFLLVPSKFSGLRFLRESLKKKVIKNNFKKKFFINL